MSKINEEHMAQLFSGFSMGCKNQPNPAFIPEVPVQPKQEECHEPESHKNMSPQSDRKNSKKNKLSFMCRLSDSNMLKVRILSATTGKSISDYIDQSLSNFLEEYESRNGNIIPHG